MKFLYAFVLVLAIWTISTNRGFSQSANLGIDNTKIITVKVKGITCSNDLKTISTNVEQVKGVQSCQAGKQGTTTTFEVKYNPILATEKEIFAAIENTEGCENPNDRPYKVKQ